MVAIAITGFRARAIDCLPMNRNLFTLESGSIVRVALPLPVDELFEYAVPPEFDEHAQPGCRVRVRVRDRVLTGVVVERTAHPQFEGRLLPIESVVDEKYR